MSVVTPAPTYAATQITVPANEQRALVDKYCVGCHNDRQKAGGLTLVNLDLSTPGSHAETLEKVVRKLRTKSINAAEPAM